MIPVLAIARATMTEARRNRVTWSLVFFCLVMLLTSFLFQEVTIAAFDRVVRDVGIAAINIFGILLGAFLSVGVLGRDLDRRTVYVLVGKPISRFQYLLGRALGVWAAVVLSLLLMVVVFIFACWAYGSSITPILFQGVFLIFVEVFVIVAIGVMASCFLGQLVAGFFTISAFFIGHFSQDIYFAGRRSASLLARGLSAGIYFALPDLERLNLKTEVSALTDVAMTRVAASAAYGLLYAMLFLLVAALVFERRDLK